MALAVPHSASERSSDAQPAPAQVLAPSTPEVLFTEHEALAESIATQFCARLSITGDQRDDFLQEGRIALYSAATRYDASRGAFEPFARATIVGALLHALRDHEPTESLTDAQLVALTEPSHEEVTQARLFLHHLLPQIGERERTAVEMYHLQGHTKAAIAARLNTSERHAARILDAGMEQLQVLAAAQ